MKKWGYMHWFWGLLISALLFSVTGNLLVNLYDQHLADSIVNRQDISGALTTAYFVDALINAVFSTLSTVSWCLLTGKRYAGLSAVWTAYTYVRCILGPFSCFGTLHYDILRLNAQGFQVEETYMIVLLIWAAAQFVIIRRLVNGYRDRNLELKEENEELSL